MTLALSAEASRELEQVKESEVKNAALNVLKETLKRMEDAGSKEELIEIRRDGFAKITDLFNGDDRDANTKEHDRQCLIASVTNLFATRLGQIHELNKKTV